jgi:hypothetical protein
MTPLQNSSTPRDIGDLFLDRDCPGLIGPSQERVDSALSGDYWNSGKRKMLIINEMTRTTHSVIRHNMFIIIQLGRVRLPPHLTLSPALESGKSRKIYLSC